MLYFCILIDGAFFFAIKAHTIEIKRVVFNIEFKQFSNHTLNLMDTWVTEFYHFTAVDTNDVIMLMVAIRFLKLCHVFAKLVFGYQIT